MFRKSNTRISHYGLQLNLFLMFKQIEGHKDKLVGKIQERYGSTREDAERQADDWLDKQG